MSDLPAVPESEPVAYCDVCKVYLHYDADIAHCPQHQPSNCPLRGEAWQALKQKVVKALLILCVVLISSYAKAQTQTTTSAAEGNHVFCTKPCQIYGGQVNNTNAASRWVMVFDAVVDPGNGAATGCTIATTTRPCILKWYQIGANSTIGISQFFSFQGASRIPVKSGFVVVCSSTGPFTVTETSDCIFSFEVTQP
jgi:hypothetical protein